MPYADENYKPLTGAAMYGKFYTRQDQQSANFYDIPTMSGVVYTDCDAQQQSILLSRSDKDEKVPLMPFKFNATNVNLQIQSYCQNSVPPALETSNFLIPTTDRPFDFKLNSRAAPTERPPLRESQVQDLNIVQSCPTLGFKNEDLIANTTYVDDSQSFIKTEYFVQESRSTVIEGQVSNCYCATERSNDLQVENFVGTESDTSDSPPEIPNTTSSTSATLDKRFAVQDPLSASQPTQLSSISLGLSKTFIPESKTDRATKYKCKPNNGNKSKDFNGKNLYTCNIVGCEKAFIKLGNMKRHLNAHSGKKKFACLLQPEAKSSRKRKQSLYVCHIPDATKLKLYFRRQTNEKTFHCTWTTCEKSFVSGLELTNHMNLHEKCPCLKCRVKNGNKTRDSMGRLLHKCHFSDCEKVYSDIWFLNRHLDWHTGKRNFFCAHCDKGFMGKGALSFHIIKVHMQNKCQCPNCSVEGGNKISGQGGKLEHNCHIDHCERVFNHPSELKKHLIWHAGKKKFFCAHCDKAFLQKDYLKHHIRVHENVERNRTENKYAGKGEIMKSVDSGTPPSKINVKANVDKVRPQLSCHIDGCGKIFWYAKYLTRHLKQDHGVDTVRPFECLIKKCGKLYDSTSFLSHHLHKDHRVKPYMYTWSWCERKFDTEKLLKNYLRNYLASQNLGCPYCRKQFCRARNLAQHLYFKHGYSYQIKQDVAVGCN